MKDLSIEMNTDSNLPNTIKIAGPLSAINAINAKDIIYEMASESNEDVCLCLENITDFDISGLNTLVTSYRRLKTYGVALSIAGLKNESLIELLSLTGFTKVLAKAA